MLQGVLALSSVCFKECWPSSVGTRLWGFSLDGAARASLTSLLCFHRNFYPVFLPRARARTCLRRVYMRVVNIANHARTRRHASAPSIGSSIKSLVRRTFDRMFDRMFHRIQMFCCRPVTQRAGPAATARLGICNAPHTCPMRLYMYLLHTRLHT